MSDSGPVFLFTVTDRFSIAGRGTVLAPGIPHEGAQQVKRGDPLLLQLPSGEIIRTVLRAFEMISRRFDAPPIRTTPILIDIDVREVEIPAGTEVFLATPDGDS